MAHTYISNLMHVVFSTKERRNLITASLQLELWPYMGGIARNNGFSAIAIGGTENHVHMLLSLPATMPISKAVQLVKGGSSKWLIDSGRRFAWQENYAAFSVSVSQKQRTIRYIESQPEHHRRLSFEQEFRSFLDKHGIEYDEKYMFG